MQLKVVGLRFKSLLAMKLLILFTVVACLQVSARGYSQTITLSLENAPLEKVFKEIKKQTGYLFVYTRAQLRNVEPVSLQVKDAELKEVLDLSFRNQPLSYVIEGRYIVVQTKTPATENSLQHAALINITGRIINESGEFLAGVTIVAKKSNKATSTNEHGEFSLKDINDDDILIITSIGYNKEEVSINRKTSFLITLRIAVGTLDETVIIGYGKTTRRLNTGSISKVSAEEINRQPVANPLAAIQGRATGVFVNTQSGMPGGNITVQIRGKGSINAGTDPLYVIDGVPFNSTPLNAAMNTLSTGIGGSISPLNSINPADIESIEILKDADATAIYGSRAANGVILITTKKGKAGKTKFDFNVYQGISRLANFPKLLNLQEHLLLRREGFQNDGITPTISNAPDLLVWDTTKSINWAKYMLGGTSPTTNVQAGLSGGNELINFLISGHYRTEGTVLPGDQKYRRAGAHIMLQHTSANKKMSVEFTSSFSDDDNNLLSSNIFSVLTLPPNLPLYDSMENYNWLGINDVNPAAVLKRKAKSKTENLLSNLAFKYSIFANLQFRVNLGYTRIQMDQVMTFPQVSLHPNSGSLGYAYYGSNRNKTYIIEPHVEYSKKIKSSFFRILLGGAWQHSLREGSFVAGSNYSNEELLEYAAAAGTTSITNIYSNYKYASLFSRIHYNYDEKYLLNVSLRRDGSSRFGPGNQFGNFGAIGLGWIFSKESFLKNQSFLNYGKIRASYGITGNDLINDYQYLSTYGTGSIYQGVIGLSPSRIANGVFRWESNRKFELSVETGFLQNRILLTATRYQNRSSNQLIEYPLPYTSGPFGTYQANLPALIENKGWEFEVNSTPIKRNEFSFSIFGNVTFPKNRLLKYPGLAASSFANTYVIGEDLSIKKALHFTGINTQTGLPEFEDIDHNGIISTPEDYTKVGKTSPDWFGGFGSDVDFHRFKLNIFFQFSKQYAQGTSTIPGTRSNKFDIALTRWQKPGDVTRIPKATVSPSSEYFNLALSDAAFYNASYLRLKNISLSYELPLSWIRQLKLSSCRLYAEAQNLVTWRKQANLYDPETANLGIAPLKSVVGGIQLTF